MSLKARSSLQNLSAIEKVLLIADFEKSLRQSYKNEFAQSAFDQFQLLLSAKVLANFIIILLVSL